MLSKIGNFLYISTGQFQRLLPNTFWHSASPRRAPSFTILHKTESTWIKHKSKINYLRKIPYACVGYLNFYDWFSESGKRNFSNTEAALLLVRTEESQFELRLDLCSLRTQTYFRLSVVSAEPEIRLRSQARTSGNVQFSEHAKSNITSYSQLVSRSCQT